MPHTAVSVGDELEFERTLVQVEKGISSFSRADSTRNRNGDSRSDSAIPKAK